METLISDHPFKAADGYSEWAGRCRVCHETKEAHALYEDVMPPYVPAVLPTVHMGADEAWSPLAEIESIREPEPADLPIRWSLIIHGIEEIQCRNIRELVTALQRQDIQEAIYKYSASLMRMEELP